MKLNVLINLKEIKDKTFVENMIKTCQEIDKTAKKKIEEVIKRVQEKIEG